MVVLCMSVATTTRCVSAQRHLYSALYPHLADVALLPQGGKYSEFEGGVRVAAFVSGGAIPASKRGLRSEALGSIADVCKYSDAFSICRAVRLD